MHDIHPVATGDVADDLEVTRYRQDVMGGPSGHSAPGSRPLLPREKAAEAAWVLHDTLAAWVLDLWDLYGPRPLTCTVCGVADYRHAEGPAPVPREWVSALDHLDLANTTTAMAGWLTRRPGWVANHPKAGQLVDEMCSAVAAARRAIDRPAHRTRFEVGPCPEADTASEEPQPDVLCSGKVWAFIPTEESAPAKMQCDTCAVEWDTTQWLRTGRRMLRVMGRDVA